MWYINNVQNILIMEDMLWTTYIRQRRRWWWIKRWRQRLETKVSKNIKIYKKKERTKKCRCKNKFFHKDEIWLYWRKKAGHMCRQAGKKKNQTSKQASAIDHHIAYITSFVVDIIVIIISIACMILRENMAREWVLFLCVCFSPHLVCIRVSSFLSVVVDIVVCARYICRHYLYINFVVHREVQIQH